MTDNHVWVTVHMPHDAVEGCAEGNLGDTYSLTATLRITKVTERIGARDSVEVAMEHAKVERTR